MVEAAQLWRLDSREKTLLVSVDNTGSPFLAWFGDTLPVTIATDQFLDAISPANPKAGLDQAQPLALFPQASTGYLGSPALAGHRQGAHFAARLVLSKHSINSNTLTLTLCDNQAQLSVELQLTLHVSTSVLAITTRLHNQGTPFQLDWLASASLPLQDVLDEVLTLSGRWGQEFQVNRQRLGFHRQQIDSTSGRTSHEHFPGLVVGRHGFSEQDGQLLAMQLGWSGNHRSIAERLSCGTAYVQTGVALLPGEVRIDSDQVWTTPTAYFTHACGLNQMSRNFHRFTREHILPAWTRTARPVHTNSWEALYFDHDESKLFALIDAAANIGAERFVLDDGWFKGRRDDTSSLGDWFVDRDVYPRGLAPVVDRVRRHGMQFGLWFEPEMISPASDLYRQHPEWALHVNGMDTPLARHQLVLNVGLQVVQDYLFDCITTLVDEYAIDYIKWDMNRNLVLPGNGSEACAEQQVRACYALLDRLLRHKPTLEIETCASGGGRVDLGILQRTGRVWPSDNIDPVDRLRIHRGFSLFFPPEIMGSHIGHETAHLTGRSTSLHTRALVALQGQYGFELDARSLSAEQCDALREYTELYKSNREWLANATHWRLPVRNTALYASGFVSSDQTRAQWTILAEHSLAETSPEKLVLAGLAADRNYQVTAHAPGLQALEQFGAELPGWLLQGVRLPGDVLMKTGLSLPVIPAQAGLLIECHA